MISFTWFSLSRGIFSGWLNLLCKRDIPESAFSICSLHPDFSHWTNTPPSPPIPFAEGLKKMQGMARLRYRFTGECTRISSSRNIVVREISPPISTLRFGTCLHLCMCCIVLAGRREICMQTETCGTVDGIYSL